MNTKLRSTRITTLLILAGLTGLDAMPLQARPLPQEVHPMNAEPICPECRVVRSPARQTFNELQAVGDFNGDGRPDVVIADKSSGLLRFGLGQPGGGFIWPKPVSVGARDLNTGIAVGRFRADRDGLALTSPGMNRIQVVHYEDAAPRSITPIGIGSSALAALPTGTNLFHDLFAATTKNSPTAPYRIELHENAGEGSAFNPVGSLPTYSAFVAARHLAAVPLNRSTDIDPALAFLLTGGGATVLQVHGVSAANSSDRIPDVTNPLTQVNVSSTVTEFDFGFFDGEEGGLMPHYLYRSTTFNTLILCPFRFGGDPSVYFFHVAAQQFWNPGAQITGMNNINVQYFSVIRREAPATDRIVITFPFGPTMAAIYDYNGVGVPTLVMAIPRPEGGDDVTGLVPLGFGAEGTQGGEWLLLTGTNGRTTGAQHYDENGTLLASGATSILNPLAGRANVFYFDADPVTSRSAQLAGTRSAGDWSVAVSNFPSAVGVEVQRFDGGERGLVPDGSRELGGVPARAAAVGINQTILPGGAEDFTGSLSLASLEGAADELIPEAIAVPSGGRYDRAVRVTFSAPESVVVRYRTVGFFQATAWVEWAGEEIDFLSSATLEWYTELDGRLRSPIRQAIYELSTSGDSDGDGVPDVVELAFGLDPNGGLDSDGDGVSDFLEILAGTDPLDPDDFPALPLAGLSAPQSGAAFTLEATIASIDGRAVGDPERLAGEGVPVTARVPGGGLLTAAPVEGEGKALLSGIPVSSDFSLVLVTSPGVYPIDVGTGTLADYGREVFALVREPATSAANLPNPSWYTGDPATEVARWTNDVWNALSNPENNVEPRASVTVDVVSTLKALLFERIVGDLLGLDEPTIHPTRNGDESRTPVVLADFDRLRNPPPPTAPRIVPKPWPFVPPEPDRPAFDGYIMLDRLDALLDNPAPDSGIDQLVNLARLIYALSTREPVISGVGASPVDALRAFIDDGILPTMFGDEIPPELLSQALDGRAELLAENGEQELVRMVLRFDYDSGTECTELSQTDDYSSRVALVNQFGRPYVFSPDFPRLPGVLVGVIGYETETPMMCSIAEITLRVMDVRLVDVPSVDGADADGNDIADAFEAQFLGGAGGNLLDTVAAGEQVYQVLQLFLEGIDAQTAAAMGLAAEDLQPEIRLEMTPDGQLRVYVEYPSRYAARVELIREDTSDLSLNEWTVTSIAILNPDGTIESFVDLDGEDGQYFRYRLQLR